MNKPFLKAVPIIEKIEKAGHEAYFVGGAVRDFLLGKEIDDVDIATSALPDEIQSIFPKTVDVGIEHGTVLIIYEHESYEVTTFRTESEYENYRKPKEVHFVRSLLEDLKRRDFTMNAMAMTKNGEIIDPFHGQDAIKNKIIKTVGLPEERFREDALRMMRAIRFVSQLDFQLDEKTYESICQNQHLLQHISVERILVEFEKLLQGKSRKKALKLIADSDLYQWLPGLKDKKASLYSISEMNIEDLNLEEMWAILMIVMEVSNIPPFLKMWRMPGKKIKKIQSICKAYEMRKKERWSKKTLYQTGLSIALMAEHIFSIFEQKDPTNELNKITFIYHSLPIKHRSELSVNGNDLIQWENKKSGPWVKQRLELIEEAVINGIVQNEKEQIRKWLYS